MIRLFQHRELSGHLMAACAAVAVCLGLLLMLLGVSLGELLMYSLYLCFVTFIPGIVLYRLLLKDSVSLLKLICVGAAVGYCLESFIFIGLKSLGLVSLWYMYPLVGVGAVLVLLWRWRSAGLSVTIEVDDRPVVLWIKAATICAVVALFMVYNACLGSFTDPQSLVPIAPDLLLHLSTAAEIKHHWPMSDPRFVGQPYAYHVLSHAHIAASSFLSGVELETILFRLYLVPLLIVVALNTILLTGHFTSSNIIKLLALIMVFFTGAFSFGRGDSGIQTGIGYFSGVSPSLVYGLVIFLPLILETITAVNEKLGRRRRLVVIGLLGAGCMLAKGSFMPVFMLGLVLAAIWMKLQLKKEWLSVIVITAVCILICVPLYYIFLHQYWAGVSQAPNFHPFAIVEKTELWRHWEFALKPLWESGPIGLLVRGRALLMASVVVLTYLIASFGPYILGVGVHFYRYGWRMPIGNILMISIIIGSLIPSYAFVLVDDNQMHFLNAGYPLMGIMTALGLGYLIFLSGISPRRLVVGLAGVLLLLVSIWNSTFSYWRYVKRIPDVLASSANVLRVSHVYKAQRWLRNKTSSDAVLAVSLFSEEDPGLARRCDYSGFAERRMLLEGSHYLRGRDQEVLSFRRKLLKKVFRDGDVSSAELLQQRFLVTHLVVDSSDQKHVSLPDMPLNLVFNNDTVRIYAFSPALHSEIR